MTCARNAEKLEELVSSCKAKGWDVSGVVADVSTPQGRTALFDQVTAHFGGELGVAEVDRECVCVREQRCCLKLMCGSTCNCACPVSGEPRRQRGPFSSTLCSDVLVNNVGTNIRKAPEEYSREDFQKLIAVNLESAFSLSQMALGPLRAAGGGAIILISSVAGGPTAMFSGAIYAMTKAAMNQLVKNLACDWAKYGIRTVAVAPWCEHAGSVGV